MKRLIYGLAVLFSVAALFAGCREDEPVMTPKLVVTDASGTVVVSLAGSENYTYELAPYQYATSASKENEIQAAMRFTVRSNMDWRVEHAEQGQDWVRLFPAEGSQDGEFRFLVERNNDQKSGREAYFNVVLNDGSRDNVVPGMIILKQAANTDFLKASLAKMEINNEGASKQKVSILANVRWTYELIPDEQYATEDLSWIEDLTKHPAEQNTDTLVFSFSDNSEGVIRGAILKIDVPEKPELSRVIPITQFGKDVEISGFPVQWIIGTGPENINFAETFPSNGYINAVTGSGRISYVSLPDKQDPNGKFKLNVGATGDPYVEGAWPGDYWEFKTDAPVASGTILKISFEAATSGTGHKFWRLEYRDGEEWIVPSSLRKTTQETGSEVVYTHTMKPSSKEKVQVSATVKLGNTTDAAHFRFVCAANWQSSGNGPLENPNGGTIRLSVADPASDEWQPTIKCVAAGSEDLVQAQIVVSGIENNLITFEGEPKGPATFSVTSDNDFSVTASQPWLHIENGVGAAGDKKEVKVTCDPSDKSEMRRAEIVVKSGISSKTILVIQSAAGGELAPLISVVGGNSMTTDGDKGEFEVQVQANVPVTVELPDWITEVPVLSKASLVETKTFRFSKSVNKSGSERTGLIRFVNKEEGLESVLKVVQEKFVVYLFQDDFSWLSPVVTKYNEANPTKGVAASVESNDPNGNAPNVYTDAVMQKEFLPLFNTKGYVDLNPSPKVLYVQDAYLKMGKTSENTGIMLPDFNVTGSVELTFDWCCHRRVKSGVEETDPTTIVVEVLKDVVFDKVSISLKDGSTADIKVVKSSSVVFTSSELKSSQPKGEMQWQRATVRLDNLTPGMRVTVRPPSLETVKSRLNRWYIDNIKVVEAY